MARKKRGQRYTADQKKAILQAAIKEKLTGAQVAKRFGVSPLTFYRWRGPVRDRRARVGGPRANGRAAGIEDIRGLVRARVQQILPGVIREQVNAYVAEILVGRGKRGRPRTRF
jgi:transposase-like protein